VAAAMLPDNYFFSYPFYFVDSKIDGQKIQHFVLRTYLTLF